MISLISFNEIGAAYKLETAGFVVSRAAASHEKCKCPNINLGRRQKLSEWHTMGGRLANLCAAKPKLDGFLMRLGQVNTHPRRRRTRVAAVSSRTCARPSDIGARLFSIPATAQCHINFICIVERERKRGKHLMAAALSHTPAAPKRVFCIGLEFLFLFVCIHCTRA